MTEHSNIWEPVAGIDTPCANMSFHCTHEKVRVLMHFSHVKDGPQLDLELLFSGAMGLRWADETHGSIVSPAVRPLPKCRDERWTNWTFPLLTISESSWLVTYPDLPGTKTRQHFALVSMNDLLDVLAFPEVVVRWVPPAWTDICV
jgi:hypothetical protein